MVKPVTVRETYTFTLQATFVTRVPAPVVTVEPMVMDMNEIEDAIIIRGTYTYVIAVTNHGLISADSGSITLPGNHPFAEWQYEQTLGDLLPNTTVNVPVTVVSKEERRRRSGGGCFDGLVSCMFMIGLIYSICARSLTSRFHS